MPHKIKSKLSDDLAAVTEKYAVAVTDAVRATINAADPQDPVGLQYLPSVAELVTLPQELADPIGDAAHKPVKGIVHRYPDRVLLTPVHVCAVYCRFCFRREKVGPGSEMLSAQELAAALDYIRAAPNVWEVILTGGDPLILSPRRLKALLAALADIPHVKVIRIHSRIPVADPARVTNEMIAALQSNKSVYMALHCNHENELSENVQRAVQKIRQGGVTLLSQSVLLKSVNDDVGVLEALFRKLVTFGVKPYYLHHPDLAPGTGHFRVSIAKGLEIFNALRSRLSGIARPDYVIDIPGGFGKVPVDTAEPDGKGGYILTDPQGRRHVYRDSIEGIPMYVPDNIK